ncbi:MAG: choice-of-anchor D domain-containing protein [Myxococcota bacterium]
MLLTLLVACSEYEVTGQKDETAPGPEPETSPDVVVDPLEIDFGAVDAGATSDPWLVTITNAGDAPLGIDGVELAAPAPFALTAVGAALLEPGDATTFTVVYQPDESGVASGEAVVSTNDPDEPTVSVLLHGESLAPDIAVDPTFHDFGTLEYQETDSVTVTVSNVGSGDLTVSDVTYTASSGELTLDTSAAGNLPWVIAAGSALTVTVHYAPTDDQPDEGTITFVSDDPDEGLAGAEQIGNARAWEGFSTGWYIVDDGTNYETTSHDPVDSYGDPDGYWYEPSGAHGMIESADPESDFAILHDYVIARAGSPTPVTAPLDFRTSSTVPAFSYASYSYVLCDFWIDAGDDPNLYTVSAATVDDGAEVIVNGQIMGYWYLGGAGSVSIGPALVPGEVNSLIVILMDNSAVDKYLTQLAFYRDGVLVTSE